MTKNERVAKLEAEIETLKARIEQLEARPEVVNVHNSPLSPLGLWSYTVYPADILLGTANERISYSYSWDGATLDAGGHVQ